MKQMLKKNSRFIIALMLFVFLGALPAMANDYEFKAGKGKTVYVPVGKGIQEYASIVTDGKIIKNSLVYPKARLDIEMFTTIKKTSSMQITPKKTGTYKVSFKYKVKGQTKKISFKVVAYNYKTKPFKSIKFGSTRIDNSMGNFMLLYNFNMGINSDTLLEIGKDTGKLSIKLNSGWSIKSAVLYKANGKKQKITLPKKLTIEDGGYIKIVFQNKKKNEAIYTIQGVTRS